MQLRLNEMTPIDALFYLLERKTQREVSNELLEKGVILHQSAISFIVNGSRGLNRWDVGCALIELAEEEKEIRRRISSASEE